MKSKEEIIAKYNFICDPDVLETVEAMMEEYQQSQPSGMRWVMASERLPVLPHPLPKDNIDERGILFVNRYHSAGAFWYPSYGVSALSFLENYNGWDVTEWEWLDESSPAGAAEGASEGISKIREVMNWISQCVDEDHDLEVSEIKMIWNDLSDAISLIESTPHSSEGMAEALAKFFAKECKVGDPLLSIIDSIYDDWKLVYDKLRIETSFSEAAIQANKFVIEKYASLSSPGSGWVNLVDELPNYGTIDVWVSDEYSKRRIPNSEYRQRDFYNKSDRFEAFMHTDDGMRWVDITNMVTHWRPLPAPPGVEDNQTKKQ